MRLTNSWPEQIFLWYFQAAWLQYRALRHSAHTLWQTTSPLLCVLCQKGASKLRILKREEFLIAVGIHDPVHMLPLFVMLSDCPEGHRAPKSSVPSARLHALLICCTLDGEKVDAFLRKRNAFHLAVIILDIKGHGSAPLAHDACDAKGEGSVRRTGDGDSTVESQDAHRNTISFPWDSCPSGRPPASRRTR